MNTPPNTSYYLKKKDETEYNGIESYVKSQMDDGSLEWIPSKTSFALERQGKTGPMAAGGDREEDGPSSAELEAKMAALLNQIESLKKAVDATTPS